MVLRQSLSLQREYGFGCVYCSWHSIQKSRAACIFIHLQFEGTTYARMRFCDLYLTHCQSCELHYMDWAIPATEATVCWRHFVDSFWVLLIFSKYWHYFFVVFLFHKVCNVLVHLAHTVTYSCSDLNLSLSKQRAAVPCGDYCCDLAMNK